MKLSRPVGVQLQRRTAPIVIKLLRMRVQWTKELNRLVMKCYLKSDPSKRGYRKRMLEIWNKTGVFETTEHQLAGQALSIKNKGWLSQVEIEEIKRNLDAREINEGENAEENHEVIDETLLPESVQLEVELEEEGITTEEERMLTQIKEKLEHPKRLEAQNLRHVDRKRLRETSTIVNSVISRVKTKNLTEINVLVLAGANVVADLMNIKKKKASRDKDPWW